ncbi:MAG: tryptophan synthase subunit alpha [Nitrospirae bacterium]|nr:MAG: tryptophan synthase subunit alpha [Nitrospirota bacterium]
MSRLQKTFSALHARHEKALIAYIMAGDPSLEETESYVRQLSEAGADVIELGVPFSDPIADGPVIQQAAERALRSGTSLKKILATVRSLRMKTQVPLVLMAYYNSIFRYGEAAFCRDAAAAGVDGLIVPDMPTDEAGTIHPLAEAAGLDVIFLLAPTSPSERQSRVARLSRGFIYYVSLTGITGAKLTDKVDVEKKVREIRRYTKTPVAVGFGIATPDDARQVARVADGVIVGSALVKLVAEGGQVSDRLASFTRSLKAATLPA